MAVKAGARAKDQTVLALDIGSRFVKIVELRLQKGVISLLNVAIMPTPMGVMDNSQILEPAMLGKSIKKFLNINKIKTKSVVAGISGQSTVIVRPIEMPRMSLKELKDNMKFEVERHIPFAVTEVIMDFSPLIDPNDLPPEEVNMKVLLAVAHEELVQKYIKVLDCAGLNAVAMDVLNLSAIRALTSEDEDDDIMSVEEPKEEKPKLPDNIALVEIGARAMEICIVTKGQLAFNRTVPVAGDTLTNVIAEQTGRTQEEAEELKKQFGKIFVEATAGELPPPEEDFFSSLDSDNPGGQNSMFGAGLDDFIIAPGSIPAETNTDDAPLPQHIFSLDDDFNDLGSIKINEPEPTAGTAQAVEDTHVDLTKEAEVPAAQTFSPADMADIEKKFPFDELELTTGIPSLEVTEEELNKPAFSFGDELANQLNAEPAKPKPASSFFDASMFSFGEDEKDKGFGESLAQEFSLSGSPFESSESIEDITAFERPDMSQDEIFQRRIFEAMQPTLVEIVTEIRRSLEFFANKEPDIHVDTIILSGGTSLLPNMVDFIHSEVGVDVRLADPLDGIDMSSCKVPEQYVRELAPALPVCIGLGLRNMVE
ncbi:MAG: type IV pilus assembly protein PilM [bacterium]